MSDDGKLDKSACAYCNMNHNEVLWLLDEAHTSHIFAHGACMSALNNFIQGSGGPSRGVLAICGVGVDELLSKMVMDRETDALALESRLFEKVTLPTLEHAEVVTFAASFLKAFVVEDGEGSMEEMLKDLLDSEEWRILRGKGFRAVSHFLQRAISAAQTQRRREEIETTGKRRKITGKVSQSDIIHYLEQVK